jgi:hypothetical protein
MPSKLLAQKFTVSELVVEKASSSWTFFADTRDGPSSRQQQDPTCVLLPGSTVDLGISRCAPVNHKRTSRGRNILEGNGFRNKKRG